MGRLQSALDLYYKAELPVRIVIFFLLYADSRRQKNKRVDEETEWVDVMQGYEMQSGSCGTELIYIRLSQVQTGREEEGGKQPWRGEDGWIPVGDLLIPPLLSRQGVAFIPLPAAGVRMIWDATARSPHPPEHNTTFKLHTHLILQTCTCDQLMISHRQKSAHHHQPNQ